MKFANLKIGTRLGAAFAALLLLLLLVAALGWSSLTRTKMNIDVITDENNLKLDAANDLQRELNMCARSVRNYILYSDSDNRREMLGRLNQANDNMEEPFARLRRLVWSERGKALTGEIASRRAELMARFRKVVALIDAGKSDEAVFYLKTAVQGPQDQLFAATAEIIALQERQNSAAKEDMNREYQFATQALLAAVIGAVVVGATLSWLITRSITGPISRAVVVAQTVAAGDLTSVIDVPSTDETGQLLQALKMMNTNLVDIVARVRGGTETIATASAQIASGNLDLSSRTEQQAGTLEETASSMEELTSTVNQNVDHARQANQLAIAASAVAVEGGAVMAQVVETMGAINDSASKIVDIIGVIDGIAFQTNILALNAAVEAARAGEQGRGFAVVATEVRNLAQRSTVAAREIKGLIAASAEKVELGSKQVDKAGSTMQAIVGSIRSVTDIMGEITAASQEQAAGIEQINQAITQMDDVTQQNASLVEQAAAASSSLQDQAASLSRAVSVFKTDAAAARLPARMAPAADGTSALALGYS
ncbi:methyl-accepting chemotaxis protein [Duganella sp. 1411]|uniref:methyl-accepting chemotaxis protein n=1 Tax=Duganella sp. 1411 TaxID=2806572 RepID=UPI001AE2A684|nr:methyl-accepting chemotaxis protein [Duganella sp. 1411]MBP1206215.1 methyl-accepting chemotaxis protein [Duganella sp. 1411]